MDSCTIEKREMTRGRVQVTRYINQRFVLPIYCVDCGVLYRKPMEETTREPEKAIPFQLARYSGKDFSVRISIRYYI